MARRQGVRLKFTAAYDGAAHAGWQSQRTGDAVQDAIEKALASICGQPVRIAGAGRTDAGVHALGQVFHADLPSPALEPGAWVRALNARLPPTVRILRAHRVPATFHARFSAEGKVYRYAIVTSGILPPHAAGRAWHVPGALSPAALRRAAALFTGRHNFAAFSATRGTPPGDTTRTIRSIEVRERGNRIAVTVEGDGFLYKMVRMIVAAMLHHAQGRLSAASIASALAAGHPRSNAVAPAAGLTLVRVRYRSQPQRCSL